MALRIYKISEYSYNSEKKQFENICQLLKKTYVDPSKECILIGNYNIEGVELDALLITTGGIRILEFKNWGGHIIARENGSWTSNRMIIEGGAGKKSPYEQIRLNKSRVTKGLTSLLGVKPANISAAIIFGQDSEIDASQLSDTVKIWLTICDNLHLSTIMKGLDRSILSKELMQSVPEKLKIEEFSLENNNSRSIVINEAYEPEVTTNFFDELEVAVSLRPDFRKTYQSFNQVFQNFINQQTNQTRLNLAGAFAKTDYLLKEHMASRKLVKTTNDTRVRLRRYCEMPESELQKFCLFDLKNICQFIAFICNCKIPGSLITLFPAEKVPSFTPLLVGECMRVIVEQWDADYVYVQTEEGSDEELTKVCYSHGNTIYNFDWSYLKDMFYKGSQLNLVRPREDDDVIYPELIIFEPDYLVNISTVAHCFTNYADSPFVELIKKFEPSKTTEPIVLGNLAGQLLDESIHQLPNTHSYAQSVKDFFKNNAIGVLTAGVGPHFHTEAQRQKQNITQAIHVSLPTALQRFNSKNGLVEPSFFSEMLGLQGRMDYLQMDFKVLLEQKSGRGCFPADNTLTIPRQTDEHYVQLLLYMALIRYNYREIYERNGKELHAFLLYSKFSQSLLGLGFSPELIYKAIKIRNGIAWTEMLYTQPNGYRVLDGLKPESFNKKQITGTFWTNCVRPQIARVLEPIQQASELEKAYYFRFLTFIANEHVMSKLGNKTKESSGFSATWHDSLSDKLAAGNIYDRLTLDWSNVDTTGRIDSVVLKFSETDDNDMSNFRTGDIVILYPYEKDKEPDVRKTMVLRGTIEDIQTDKILLALRAPQADNRVFVREKGKLWAIEHDFMESSYSSLYRGMQSFLSAPQQRRDLILLQREPEIDNTVELKGDYKEFNDLALHVKRAKDMFLIIGPPGTGKTSFGLLSTVMEEHEDPNSNILLLSYTNRAVDEICSKLTKERIDFIRIGGPLSCAEEYKENLLSSIAQNVQKVSEFRDILLKTRVIVGTTTSLNSNISLFQLKQFSLAVIDEASQILEPHLIGLLSANIEGVPAIRKFVLIGDHKQLPAVVQQEPEISKVQDAILNNIHLTDCRLSLFERLLKQYVNNKDVTYMLKKQGRMHPDIALFPNYAFYGNKLEAVPMPHQKISLPLLGTGKNGIDDLLTTRRIAFIASEIPQKSPTDKVNQNEADMIAAIVVRIYEIEKSKGFDVNTTVGVIVPYRNQIAAVRKTIDQYGISILHDITIDTVERYQGSQRKYIIYGFTIQKYYQLNFLTNNVFEDFDGSIIDRKLNVAMTRAEEHLIMIGNPGLLSNNFTFFKLIEFVNSKNAFFKIEKDKFVSGNFVIPEYDAEEFDLSKAIFTVSESYNAAYKKYILQPVKAGSIEWPLKVFGHNMDENLNAIGYGRINFSNQLQMFDEVTMSPERQVLIYCYYIMRQHYCSSRNIYTSYKDWIGAQISSVKGRVHMIDIGCGPATCGVAFAELFREIAPDMFYTGIDISIEMKRMGGKLIDDVFEGKLRYQMKESFTELDGAFWDDCSELPSMVLINISYFFSNVSAQFTERLATQIAEVIKRYPLNKYVFLVQHSEHDKKLNSYRVFNQVIGQMTKVIKSEKSSFLYQLNGKERTMEFCYDIMMNV